MANSSKIQGENNIVIQEVTNSSITLNVNGDIQEIQNELVKLRALLNNLNVKHIQYADKIYNIEHINEANFGIITSNRIFNGVLARTLIEHLQDDFYIKDFLNQIPPEDKDKWECINIHLNDAQRLLEDRFIWVIGSEMRRLFAIGNDKKRSVDSRVKEYIDHCFSAYRLALQLVNYLFITTLWDAKKQNDKIISNKKPVRDFFSKRPLRLKELRTLLHTLINIFKDNNIEFPLAEITEKQIAVYLNSDSEFNKACESMEGLKTLEERQVGYGLGHCHTAEISLATILESFSFFTTHQLVTMTRVEYEEVRHSTPYYIKDFSILNRIKASRRILKYDTEKTLTCAVLYRNQSKSVNLFPFLIDFNALTNEKGFQILVYESRHEKSSLRFYSINKEEERKIEYRKAFERFCKKPEIKSEEQKREEQTSIRLDLVIKQFEDAMNTILGTDERFMPVSDVLPENYHNI